MRLAAQETGDEKTWVIFDGPVDAIWIENMNTVLDDNMTLCLSNGQRIKLRKEMRMLFEVNDLLVASPATVSRCGMVYLTPEELGWRPYVRTWIDTYFDPDDDIVTPKMKEFMWSTFEATIDIGLEFIRQNCKEPIKTTDLQQVTGICNYLEGFIDFTTTNPDCDEVEIQSSLIKLLKLIIEADGQIKESEEIQLDFIENYFKSRS